MAIGAILTLGLGAFASATLLPTLGYHASARANAHSPYYSEYSEYAFNGGELKQRFPWGKRKPVVIDDNNDILDIMSFFDQLK